MRNRNVLVLIIAAVLICVVALLAFLPKTKREVTAGATVEPVSTAAPNPSNESSEISGANAYLLVTVNGTIYEPIPLTEKTDYTIRQPNGMENVIHVTPDSICMQSSTCDNQDCVLQGTVTLENMSQRVLGNMVICLPNQVTLELFTPEGLSEALVSMGVVTGAE